MKTENLYTPNCIRTFSGLYMNVFEPTPEMICIEDIAHALSHQCRFGGHLPRFYSVAEHSILVCEISEVLMPDTSDIAKFTGLMHDASEAYLLDIPSPIKAGLSNYKELETKLMLVIAAKFGFDWPMNRSVEMADKYMLEAEWEHIMLEKRNCPSIKCFTPAEAKLNFLDAFKKYKPKNKK